MNDCKVLRYDYEIVRGVECCFRDQAECDNCPYKGIENCSAILQGEVATFLESKLETIDYILEQWNNAEKEIKGLKKSNRNWRRKVQRLRKPLPASYVSMMVEQTERQKQKAEEYIANVKSEAYKEFAERLKERFAKEKINECYIVIDNDVDNLLKELVGD